MNLEPVAVNVLVLATQSLLLCTCADCTLYSFQMLKYIVELLIILFQWKTAIPAENLELMVCAGDEIFLDCTTNLSESDILVWNWSSNEDSPFSFQSNAAVGMTRSRDGYDLNAIIRAIYLSHTGTKQVTSEFSFIARGDFLTNWTITCSTITTGHGGTLIVSWDIQETTSPSSVVDLSYNSSDTQSSSDSEVTVYLTWMEPLKSCCGEISYYTVEAAEQMDTRVIEAVGGGAEAVLSLPSNYHGVINVSAINTCNSSSIITVAINIENDDEVIINNSSDAQCKTHLQQQDRFAPGVAVAFAGATAFFMLLVTAPGVCLLYFIIKWLRKRRNKKECNNRTSEEERADQTSVTAFTDSNGVVQYSYPQVPSTSATPQQNIPILPNMSYAPVVVDHSHQTVGGSSIPTSRNQSYGQFKGKASEK